MPMRPRRALRNARHHAKYSNLVLLSLTIFDFEGERKFGHKVASFIENLIKKVVFSGAADLESFLGADFEIL